MEIWRSACADLRTKITEGRIGLKGRRQVASLPEPIEGHVLAGLNIRLPLALDVDGIMARVPSLAFNPGGEGWGVDGGDKIENGWTTAYSHLQVLGSGGGKGVAF